MHAIWPGIGSRSDESYISLKMYGSQALEMTGIFLFPNTGTELLKTLLRGIVVRTFKGRFPKSMS